VTLPQFLDTLTFDNGKPLIWGRDVITQGQLARAEGDPYVVFRLMGIISNMRLHQGEIFDQGIELTIYREPSALNTVPSAGPVMKLWNALFMAPKYVDEGMYGRSIIELRYAGGFAPSLGERSSGLVAAIRFNEVFGYAAHSVGG